MSNSVLITGAHGFLGRNTAVEFKHHGWRVTGIGHGKWSTEDYRAFGIDDWIESDITVDNLKRTAEGVSTIVHCAGSGSVGFSLSSPAEDYNRTVNTTLAVLEYIRLHNINTRLIYPSSAAVYGAKGVESIYEEGELRPVSPYGYHKKIAEELTESYARNFSISVSIIRFFSLYGNGLKKQLLWDACNKFSGGDKIVVFSGTGDETRDWLHIRDAARLIYAVSLSCQGIHILNGGSGTGSTVREILELVGREFGKEQMVSFNGLAKEGDPKHYQADIRRSISLGWEPEIDWQSGMKEYVEWFRETKRLT